MNKPLPIFFLIIVVFLLVSCGSPKQVPITRPDTVSSPPPMGMSGFETDRITGLGIEHVIHISVDGLHSSAITTLGVGKLPGFYSMRNNGSFTDNARTDGDYAYTLPNHSCQLTGRPVDGDNGHQVRYNSGEPSEACSITFYSINDDNYIASVFDVVHDFGMTTALYTGKPKFSLFDNSWNENNGAIDAVEPDSGQDKIDDYEYNVDTEELVDSFITNLTDNKHNYAFLHLKDPDSAGHSSTWSLDLDSEYLTAVERVDALLVKILEFIDTNDDFKDSTVLILTADHGGEFGYDTHGLFRDLGLVDSSIIPFYIYGKFVPAGEDLYSWNPTTTVDPGDKHPFNDDELQPIRNGDAANLSLELLGLPPVPGSSINNLDFPYF